MPANPPTGGGFNLGSDPEIQAMKAEMEQSLRAMEAQFELDRQRIEMQAAIEEQARRAAPAPPADPPHLAELERIEAEYGVSVPGAHADIHGAQTRHEVLHTLENVVEQALEHRHQAHEPPPLPGAAQWFYAREAKSVGPVTQEDLVKQLQSGALPWSTLVWRRPLKEWKPASDTELAELAGPGKPPPLPPA